jgi:hypothetical protein
LAKYIGQTLTAKEILEICGYSPKTGIRDTALFKNGIIREYHKGATYPDLYLIAPNIRLYVR